MLAVGGKVSWLQHQGGGGVSADTQTPPLAAPVTGQRHARAQASTWGGPGPAGVEASEPCEAPYRDCWKVLWALKGCAGTSLPDGVPPELEPTACTRCSSCRTHGSV